MKNKNNVIVIIFMFIIMALNAVSEQIRGVFIPSLKLEFRVDNTRISLMFFVGSIAYILFTYLGGILCEKIGQKKVFILGLSFMVISLFILPIVKTYNMFLISMFIMNIGLALTSIAINTLVPVLFVSYQAVLMNLTHFCYGLGGASGQALGGILLTKGITWRRIYFGIAVLFALLLITFIFIKLPHTHKHEKDNKINILDVLKNKLVYFYVAALGFYVFAEIGTASWMINFIQDTYKYNASKSSFYSFMFLATFSVGRLVGGFIVEKLGYIKTVLYSLIVAVILFISGLVVGEGGLIAISMSGFFFAVTFPTLVVTISKVFKNNTSYITGVVVTLTSSVNMILNLVIGRLNDNLGTYTAFYMIPCSLIISIIFVYLIYINTKNNLLVNRGDNNE